MEDPLDRPGVLIFPPLIMGLALLSAIALDWLWPLPIFVRPVAPVLGTLLSIFGAGSAAWGRKIMVQGGTNVSPMKPSTAIVTEGPFRFSRNPLYVGLTSLFIGLSLLIGTWWGCLLFFPAVLVLHYGVVVREERYLEQKFGDRYLSYKNAVRRYL
jgi:protein-S-isoprenylcysteine O-methyltransferase Ste14